MAYEHWVVDILRYVGRYAEHHGYERFKCSLQNATDIYLDEVRARNPRA